MAGAVDMLRRRFLEYAVTRVDFAGVTDWLGDVESKSAPSGEATTVQLDLTAGFYINDVLDSLTIDDICSGVGKSIFFAYFIAVIGCHNGLSARGGADGVGRATTDTVVMASIMVLVSDFFLTKLFYVVF